MKLLRRHRSVLIALGVYWPFLFWLTHIPVPLIARQSGMSDKTMHVMAYAALSFLVWFAISPYQKVRWSRPKVWIVLVAVVGYGVIDEYLQAHVGRSTDMMDLVADLFGMILGLGLLSVLNFWPALLIASAVFIFMLSDMTRLMTLPQYTFYAAAFHFTAYTAFTLIWIQWLERFSRFSPPKPSWLAVSLLLPAGLLLFIKAVAPFCGRPVGVFNTIIAIVGIVATILISCGLLIFFRKRDLPQ